MASFLDSPYLGMGVGLLAAAQPQPPGQNRYSILMGAMNQANQQRMQSQLFKMRIEESERKKKERTGKQEALSTLIGGYQPSTDITWNQGRAGMTGDQRMSLLGQADPETFTKEMLKSEFDTGGDAKTFQLKIDELRAQDVPHEIAVKTVTGAYRNVVGADGRGKIVDITNNRQVWPPQTPSQAGSLGKPEPYDIGEGSLATGGSGALGMLANTLIGTLGAGIPFENIEDAANRMNTLTNFTVLGLSQGMAARDTNQVRTLIQEMLPTTAKLFESDERALSKIKAVRDYIASMKQQQLQIQANPYDYSPKEVREAAGKIQNMSLLEATYDKVIQNWVGKTGGPRIIGGVEFTPIGP